MENEFKGVFKKTVAMALRDMGFRIMDAKVNANHPDYVIYYFEDTKEFREAFDKLHLVEIEKKKKKKYK